MACLRVSGNSRNSVSLEWKDLNTVHVVPVQYKLQMKERVNKWITVYSGSKTEVEIHDLSPGESHHFRLTPITTDKLNTHWSLTVGAVTKVDVPAVEQLHRAIEMENIVKIQKFIKARPTTIDTFDRLGRTGLMLATKRDNSGLVSLLLTAGADVNISSFGLGRTALMVACMTGAVDIVQLLTDRGASWHTKDKNGCTALNYAIDASQLACLTIALDNLADIETRDRHHWTPLMRAVMLECPTTIICELLNRGANVDACDERNVSCLMLATLSGRSEVVQLLVSRGAKRTSQDIYNNTALDMALKRNTPEILNLLQVDDNNDTNSTSIPLSTSIDANMIPHNREVSGLIPSIHIS